VPTTTTTERHMAWTDLVLEGLSHAEATRIGRSNVYLRPDFFPAFPTYGLAPEMESVRDELARLRELLLDAVHVNKGLDARFKAEDEARRRDLMEAALTGDEPQKDTRDDEADRASIRTAARERVVGVERAIVQYLATVADTFRAHEAEWLGGLRAQLEPVAAKRMAAQRLLAEAHEEEWRLAHVGLWLQRVANGDGMGLVAPPAPDADPGPVIPPDAFERPAWDAANRSWLGGEDPAKRRLRAIRESEHDNARTLTPAELGDAA
jgi:hypothetical protein